MRDLYSLGRGRMCQPTRTNYHKIAAKVFAVMVLAGIDVASFGVQAAEVWFSPDNDTPDYLDLFRRPDLWSRSRSQISVLKLGPQQAGGHNPSGKNTLSELQQANAFNLLAQWNIKLAIEVPAIKPWDCSGHNAAKMTLQLIDNVFNAGGDVKYLTMDEPYVSGIIFCKDTMENTAAKTAEYIRNIQRQKPQVQVGETEVYPYFNVGQLIAWLKALQRNGVTPAHFHLDVNVHRLDVSPDIDLTADLTTLRKYLRLRKIPFGIIFWSGYNPEPTDEAYFDRTMRWTKRVHAAIGSPDQIIIQSWILRSSPRCGDTDARCYPEKLQCTRDDPPGCGKKTIPVNLPENDPSVYSHTRLINEILNTLQH